MKRLFFITILLFVNLSAQNAADYFPAAPGHKWYFKITPFDSLSNPIDSLISYQIDTFAASVDYSGKFAHLVLSKNGTPAEIIQSPYMDSSFIHTENSNIWNYVKGLGGIGSILPFNFEGWYSVYRLDAAVSSPYTLFTKDTIVTIDSTDLNLRFEVTGRRLADQQIITPYGTLNCKKFLLRPSVKYIPPIPIPITLVTLNDTVWIAPGYYIVKSIQPSAVVDFSLFGFPSFTIPGTMMEAIPVPPILNAEPNAFNISFHGDTTSIFISNTGEGTLNWNAEIITGADWLSFYSSSSGGNNDSLVISVTANVVPVARIGLIKIEDEEAFNSPQFITVNQEGIILSASEKNNSPSDYFLGQNYPNPFNPETNIDFSVKAAGNVKIILYDILGNNISVITEGFYSPGEYKIKFIPDNLSSGMYIYRMTTNGFTASNKMVVIK